MNTRAMHMTIFDELFCIPYYVSEWPGLIVLLIFITWGSCLTSFLLFSDHEATWAYTISHCCRKVLFSCFQMKYTLFKLIQEVIILKSTWNYSHNPFYIQNFSALQGYPNKCRRGLNFIHWELFCNVLQTDRRWVTYFIRYKCC